LAFRQLAKNALTGCPSP